MNNSFTTKNSIRKTFEYVNRYNFFDLYSTQNIRGPIPNQLIISWLTHQLFYYDLFTTHYWSLVFPLLILPQTTNQRFFFPLKKKTNQRLIDYATISIQ